MSGEGEGQNQGDGSGRDDQSGASGGEPRDDEGLKRALAAERRRAKEAEKAAEDARREAEELRQQAMSDEERKLEDARRDGMRQAKESSKALEQENLRLRVALDMGLPGRLVDRLRGSTQEEIEADAKELMDLMGIKPKAQGDGGGGNSSGDDGKSGRLDTGGGRRDGEPAKVGSISETRERFRKEREAQQSQQVDPFKGWGPMAGGKIS